MKVNVDGKDYDLTNEELSKLQEVLVKNKFVTKYKQFRDFVNSLIQADINKEYYRSDFPYVIEHRTFMLNLPRQIGKTTLLDEIASKRKNPLVIVCNEMHKSNFSFNRKTRDNMTTFQNLETKLMGKTFDYDCVLLDEYNHMHSSKNVRFLLNQIHYILAPYLASNKTLENDFFILGLSS